MGYGIWDMAMRTRWITFCHCTWNWHAKVCVCVCVWI